MTKSLAENIGILMGKEGLQPSELAIKLGIPKATFHKIMTGKSARPRTKTLKTISEYFKIPVVQLLHGRIADYDQQERVRHIPIIDWSNINSWLQGGSANLQPFHTTPINLNLNQKSFALVLNDANISFLKQSSILIFDPTLEVKDGAYVLVKLSQYPEILLRQIICDASNAKYIKSLNQEFSTNIKKLDSEDKIVAVLVMAKTLYYYK